MNPANANPNRVIQSVEAHFALPLSDEARQAIQDVFGEGEVHRFGAAPAGGPNVAASLPADFWSNVLAKAGPLVQYLLQTLLSLIPVTALNVGAATLGAALPNTFWGKALTLFGSIVVSMLRSLLESVANPAYVEPQPEATS